MKIEEKGLKERSNKIMLELVLPETIEALGEVLTYGAQKYKPNSWQNVDSPIDTHYAALFRHLLAWRKGELDDDESGFSHMKHVLTNAMFLLYHEQRFLRK
jgi:hypothetical protein